MQELEERTDAQSDVNIDTATQLDNLTNNSTKVETKGGLKVTSADKKFEASLGGRIHFDAYAFGDDVVANTNATEFRRARLTLSGKAYGWEYKMEQDFAAGTNLDGIRDLYIARPMLGGKLTIGHFKPYRSMEELTSSNEILMMERPVTSASGPKVAEKGLWELTARYETMENNDVADMGASSTIFGVNYYVNPNMRLMFNYVRGHNDKTGDDPNQFALRTQFAF